MVRRGRRTSRVRAAGVAMAFGHAMIDTGLVINKKMRLGLYFRYQFSPFQDFSSLPPESPTIAPGTGFWNTKQECLGLGLPGDCILGLRYRLFVNDSDRIRIHSTLGTGVGRVRNWLRLKQRTDAPAGGSRCDGKPIFSETPAGSAESVEFCFIKDTVRTGWLHIGIGGGVEVPLTNKVAFAVDTYLMILAPETSINFDLNGGFTFLF